MSNSIGCLVPDRRVLATAPGPFRVRQEAPLAQRILGGARFAFLAVAAFPFNAAG